METKVYNQTGEEVGMVTLPDSVFNLPLNFDLLQQVRVSLLANRRSPIAHTKDRAEVSGGGKKPWRQKGTGRARHGSIRSPIWRGGGIAHGPRNTKVFSRKINNKMAQKALGVALSSKLKAGKIKILEDGDFNFKKTKDFKIFSDKFLNSGRSLLMVLSKPSMDLLRASANLPKIKIVSPHSLNLLDVLSFNNVIIVSEALKSFK